MDGICLPGRAHFHMRLRANHLTTARIILLPLPYILLYGGAESRVIALVILTILGITDYLDGLLARLEGATALGALLDPLADKIFIAVMLIPLIDLGILPIWVVWPIFLREFLVTDLRHVLKQAGRDLPVTEIAKIKTTLQMTGAGLILITDTYPEKIVPVAFISGALVATIFLAVALYIRDGAISSRMKVALAMLATALTTRLCLDARTSVLIYGMVIMAITLASGAQYVTKGLPECLRQGPGALLKLIASLAVPMIAVTLIPMASRDFTVLILLILCLEFAAQGIDMWAAQKGKRDISKIKLAFIVPLCLLSLVIPWTLLGQNQGIILFLWTSLGLNVLYVLTSSVLHILGAGREHCS